MGEVLSVHGGFCLDREGVCAVIIMYGSFPNLTSSLDS